MAGSESQQVRVDLSTEEVDEENAGSPSVPLQRESKKKRKKNGAHAAEAGSAKKTRVSTEGEPARQGRRLEFHSSLEGSHQIPPLDLPEVDEVLRSFAEEEPQAGDTNAGENAPSFQVPAAGGPSVINLDETTSESDNATDRQILKEWEEGFERTQDAMRRASTRQLGLSEQGATRFAMRSLDLMGQIMFVGQDCISAMEGKNRELEEALAKLREENSSLKLQNEALAEASHQDGLLLRRAETKICSIEATSEGLKGENKNLQELLSLSQSHVASKDQELMSLGVELARTRSLLTESEQRINCLNSERANAEEELTRLKTDFPTLRGYLEKLPAFLIYEKTMLRAGLQLGVTECAKNPNNIQASAILEVLERHWEAHMAKRALEVQASANPTAEVRVPTAPVGGENPASKAPTRSEESFHDLVDVLTSAPPADMRLDADLRGPSA